MSFLNTLRHFLTSPVQAVKTSWWWYTNQNPNANCSILRLPPDAILLIADQLPDHGKVLFSQTCRALKSILHKRRLSSLSGDERVKFLTHLSRNAPNVWVCAVCQEQHPVTRNDLTGDWWLSSCPEGTLPSENIRPETLFTVSHSRVQLALKYSRLGAYSTRFQLPLYTLLKHETRTRIINDGDSLLFCLSSSLPKVVDGRYLVQYRWTYRLDNVPPSARVMTHLMVCPHQRVSRSITDAAWGEERKQLIRALEEALVSDEAKDTESRGSCSICPTDFAVRISRQSILIQAWKDLGPEDAPSNQAWMSHLRDNVSARRPLNDLGSIRQLFHRQD